LSVISLIAFMNRIDTWVIESRGGLTFTDKSLLGFGVGCKGGGEKKGFVVGERLADEGDHCASFSAGEDGMLFSLEGALRCALEQKDLIRVQSGGPSGL
jgi:hypothetical protein